MLALSLVVAACSTGTVRTAREKTPLVGASWQWQLTGRLDPTVDATVFDVDGQTTSVAEVADLHRRHRYVICYVSVGTWESFRPDADRFPRQVIGKPLATYPDERWLDIRRIASLSTPLGARLDECRHKGFDGVEPDNVDGYANDSGFPLSADDQLRFNRWIAAEVHRRGMTVALKNDVAQVPQLVDAFDYAVNEECVANSECDELRPFIRAAKPVFNVEYDIATSQFCPQTKRLGFSSMRKHRELDAWRQPC